MLVRIRVVRRAPMISEVNVTYRAALRIKFARLWVGATPPALGTKLRVLVSRSIRVRHWMTTGSTRQFSVWEPRGIIVVHEDRRFAGEHIVRVDQLRRSRRRHGVDHDPELGGGQSRHGPLIDGSRR